MVKTFTIKDNELILNIGTSAEANLTEREEECDVCIYDVNTCKGNRKGVYCDMLTVNDEYEELDIL